MNEYILDQFWLGNSDYSQSDWGDKQKILENAGNMQQQENKSNA